MESNQSSSPASDHNPKEEVKEHATDKFTEEKVEREVPDPVDQDTEEQNVVVEEEIHREETTTKYSNESESSE